MTRKYWKMTLKYAAKKTTSIKALVWNIFIYKISVLNNNNNNNNSDDDNNRKYDSVSVSSHFFFLIFSVFYYLFIVRLKFFGERRSACSGMLIGYHRRCMRLMMLLFSTIFLIFLFPLFFCLCYIRFFSSSFLFWFILFSSLSLFGLTELNRTENVLPPLIYSTTIISMWIQRAA